ncbi:MAG: putative toxin-antitoxin system toxin component, PIN family [Gemmatimonadetes bacterium]|nr:putative toxin-antitoxin system toxin component, PIN family [Gemmatimonadota bacterium]MDE3260046.1 putative toxin-antitoxin system toxin component, PIN family [Gemmatimonadota bacterium]
MNSNTRYVFDTNVLVSALIFEDSKPGHAIRYALRNGQVLLSLSALEELAEVMSREKFGRYVTAEERDEFLQALVARARFIEPAAQIRICRDPKDDKFLELAISGAADHIISGDDDMLALSPFRGIEILTPDDFLSRMEGP